MIGAHASMARWRWRIVCVRVASWALLSACDGGTTVQRTQSMQLSVPESLATAREIQASLSGDGAPGRQAYVFRGLYAGMSRVRLEARVRAPATCRPLEQSPGDLMCSYESTIGADDAHVSVEAEFGATDAHGERMTRIITASRELPLDVDGVRLARALSDAFEAQTAMLDKRDASYGPHQAQVRMGTVNGARQNFVDLSVAPKAGRELLVVKMSRR